MQDLRFSPSLDLSAESILLASQLSCLYHLGLFPNEQAMGILHSGAPGRLWRHRNWAKYLSLSRNSLYSQSFFSKQIPYHKVGVERGRVVVGCWQIKSSLPTAFVNKVYYNTTTPFIYLLSMPAFVQ